MTFVAFEESAEQSAPIEVYEFSVGSDTWNYTSAETEKTIGGRTYTPLAIEHGNRVDGPEERQSVFTIRVPSDTPIAQLYTNIPPGQRGLVKVKRYQLLDTVDLELTIIFDGTIRTVSFESKTQIANISAQPAISSTTRPAPRAVYSSACNHVLYDSRCGVDPDDAAYKVTSTVSGVTDKVLTVPGLSAFADGFFTAGFIELADGSDARTIFDHTGNDITLHYSFPGVITSESVIVRAGCSHDSSTCVSKFNNFINYGGFPFVPLKNPFESGIL